MSELRSPYEPILLGFQNAEADFGDELFFLAAMTETEMRRDKGYKRGATAVMGFVQTGPKDSGVEPGFWIVGPACRRRAGKWREPFHGPAWIFESLARQAGAYLPAAEREIIRYPTAGPSQAWLSYMWWSAPPSEADLAPPDGKRRKCRVIWSQPFTTCIELIERRLLGAFTPPSGVSGPSLTKTEVKILRAVHEMGNLAADLYTIESHTLISRKTIGDCLRKLVSEDLVARPNGPRSGVAITDKGRRVVESVRDHDDKPRDRR